MHQSPDQLTDEHWQETISGNMEKRKFSILHLRKNFVRDAPLSISYVRGVDNERFTHIICYLGKNKGLTNVLSDQGYETIYLGFDKESTEHFNLRVSLALAQVLKEKHIDILHCQKHKPTIYGTIASLLAGCIPVMSHIHGLGRTRSFRRRLTNWIFLRYVTKIIAVSDSVRQDVLNNNWGLQPQKVVTVRNCIDIQKIDSITITKKEARTKIGLSDEEFVFGTIGRLAPTKGQGFLIEAYAEAMKKIPASKLVIVGEGPLMKQLQKKAGQLAISENILFTGYRNDVLELLRGFDIFVLPSLAEGLSIALLEAMASGLPIVASRVGGIPEVCGQAGCGILVAPKNVSALASSMIEIASLDADDKKRLGQNARKRIEQEFTVDIMVKKLTEIYDIVLQEKNQ